MKVAKVFFNKQNRGSLVGFADIMFRLTKDGDGCFTIKGWKLMDGENGKWLAPPSEKGNDGNYYDRVLFKKENEDAASFREYLLKEVLAEAERKSEPQVKKNDSSPKPPQDDDDEYWNQ